ncbi:MAG TPA: hypothetical protein VE476_01065 [Propionibacteriaceae bacterium]|jgi:hypothetical protein|nr:hypothetical protein [Propionibacteriaceae bacterium]
MITIQRRAEMRDTCSFVTTETVDVLAEKLIGLADDRRITVVRRYLGDHGGAPTVLAGLRIDRRGRAPVEHRRGQSVRIHLRPGIESLGFSVQRDSDTEEGLRERYHHPERHWLGRREDIVYVELRGWPGSPHREDCVRVERWNSNGVGEEIIAVFDDIDPVSELFWDTKGDKQREVHMWDEFCDAHGLHFEHPSHERNGSCMGRKSTRAEDLGVLALLVALADAKDD